MLAAFKSFNDYKYWDTPEGQDTFKKIWCASKDVGAFSLGLATLDILLHHRYKGYVHALGRYGYYCVPMLGMTAGFIAVTNLAKNTREKDDKVNWVYGACTSGLILGAWRKSLGVGAAACIGFSVMAIVKKHALQNDWTLFDRPISRQESGIRPFAFDWTLTDERPGNWTKCE